MKNPSFLSERSVFPAFTLGALLDDHSRMPEDIIAPRILTPGGMLVLGGAPKVGKSDFLLTLLVHMAAGLPFLGFSTAHPRRIFYLQSEIQYHYLRERLQNMPLDRTLMAAARDNFVVTSKERMILDACGVERVIDTIRAHYGEHAPDILCFDPIRNLFDSGPGGGGENDNGAMLFFLRERIEVLRDAVGADVGLILCHHTRKTGKKQFTEDPFAALSGAGSLRGFYTSGIIMHQPAEERSERMLHFEMRNGKRMEEKLIDKKDGCWFELPHPHKRGTAERKGRGLAPMCRSAYDTVIDILRVEAAEGRLYTMNRFVDTFKNQHGLGGKDTIRAVLDKLATRGAVKFVRDGSLYGLGLSRSRFGFLCVEGMSVPTLSSSGEVLGGGCIPVVPTHYKSPQTGSICEISSLRESVFLKEG